MRAPILVHAAARIGVLVERGAVEARQRESIGREVRRHPVEDHADAGPMKGIDQRAQIVRRAEASGGGEIAGGLVAPGFVQRMLGDRQQLDMREAEILARRGPGARRAPRRCRSARPGGASRSPGAPRRCSSARCSQSQCARASIQPLIVATRSGSSPITRAAVPGRRSNSRA